MAGKQISLTNADLKDARAKFAKSPDKLSGFITGELNKKCKAAVSGSVATNIQKQEDGSWDCDCVVPPAPNKVA